MSLKDNELHGAPPDRRTRRLVEGPRKPGPGRPSKLVAVAALAAFLGAASPVVRAAGQESPEPATAIQPISWEAWLQAKVKAEENDAAGNLVTALQYYLEYARQAEGLNNPARVAWGKNNAAYMIIKMHRLDPTVDLAPAEKLLSEGLALTGTTEDCRKVMAMNLEHVRTCLRTPR